MDQTTSNSEVYPLIVEGSLHAMPTKNILHTATTDSTASELSDADSDVVSTTSTIEYGHESFSTFHESVVQLCDELWDKGPDTRYEITRMNGGGFNRVIGIDVIQTKKNYSKLYHWFMGKLGRIGIIKGNAKETERLIIRIPRSPNAWVEHEVAMIHFLDRHTTLPAPKVLQFDFSESNTICQRYTIQPRIPGRSVVDCYLDLNTEQRVTFARDLGEAMAKMMKVYVDAPGTLRPESILGDSGKIDIIRFQCPNRNAFRPAGDEIEIASSPQGVFDFLKTQFNRQRGYDLTLNRHHINPWMKLLEIAEKLHEFGFLEDSNYYLTHMDFEPRNIMVHVSDRSQASLSAIMDWDEAVFAPIFVNCTPPSWLWDFEGDDDEELDESQASDLPSDPDLRAIKTAFDSAAGSMYQRYAYTPEYRIARKICRIAITCIHSNEDYKTLESAISEWNQLYPDHAVKGIWDVD